MERVSLRIATESGKATQNEMLFPKNNNFRTLTTSIQTIIHLNCAHTIVDSLALVYARIFVINFHDSRP